ncbi:MAG: Na+/H+ antiporter [Chloroflexales bacterium]|nr:Na+/H+ antiporter [Chloroflexales bacterium]
MSLFQAAEAAAEEGLDPFLSTEILIIQLLVIASLVAMVVRRVQVPYTVALVVVGLFVTFQSSSMSLGLTPDIILALFVPPLIFEASFHIDFKKLRDQLFPILMLAGPGVLLSMFIVGFIVSSVIPEMSLPVALVFGALISATDPVAVIALFKSLGAPKQLELLVDGESILNDGTGAVMFKLMLSFAVAAAAVGVGEGAGEGEHSSILVGFMEFLWVSGLGVGIGIGLGWVVSKLISGIDDSLIVTTLTTALPFGAFLMAEQMEVSGILAVFGAGLVCGNVGMPTLSPSVRIATLHFWEYLTFLVNSLVFLLIGLDMKLTQIIDNIQPIAIAVGACMVSRVIVVYGFSALVNWTHHAGRSGGLSWLANWSKEPIPMAYQHVMFWGALRGAVGLALALSLDPSFPGAELIKVMTFGVVLFTLIVQAMTMGPLLRMLGLVDSDPNRLEIERRRARLIAARTAREHLEQMHQEGMISDATWKRLLPHLDVRIQTSLNAHQAMLHEQPSLLAEEHEQALREGLRAQRAMLKTLAQDNVISGTVYEELSHEIDAALDGKSTEAGKTLQLLPAPRLDEPISFQPSSAPSSAPAPVPAPVPVPAPAPAPAPRAPSVKPVVPPTPVAKVDDTISIQPPPAPKNILQLGIEAARTGKKDQARSLFQILTAQEPDNIQAWLWLAGLTKDDRNAHQHALERVLALDPNNTVAIQGLQALGVPVRRNGTS